MWQAAWAAGEPAVAVDSIRRFDFANSRKIALCDGLTDSIGGGRFRGGEEAPTCVAGVCTAMAAVADSGGEGSCPAALLSRGGVA